MQGASLPGFVRLSVRASVRVSTSLLTVTEPESDETIFLGRDRDREIGLLNFLYETETEK